MKSIQEEIKAIERRVDYNDITSAILAVSALEKLRVSSPEEDEIKEAAIKNIQLKILRAFDDNARW